jgi:hypothetical protein
MLLVGPWKMTLATAAGPRFQSSASNPGSGLQYCRYAPAASQTAVTLPPGVCRAVPFRLGWGDGVAAPDLADFTWDRFPAAADRLLSGPVGPLGVADGTGWSVVPSGLMLRLAPVSC